MQTNCITRFVRISLITSAMLLIAAPAAYSQQKQKAQKQHDEKVMSALTRLNKANLKTLTDTLKQKQIDMAQVIATAEKATEGMAISTRIQRPLSDLHFTVICVNMQGQLHAATVDALENKVISKQRVTQTGTSDTAAESDWIVGVVRYTIFRLIPQDAVIDSAVANPAGQSLGDIDNLAIEPSTGRVVYAALDVDTSWGLEEQYYAVPMPAFEVALTGNLLLNVTRKELRNASGFDEDDWPLQANWRWAADLGTATSADFELVAAEQYDPMHVKGMRRSAALANRIKRGSEIIGMTVVNKQGQELGEIENLYIDPDRSRINYAVLAHGGTLGFGEARIPIPWMMLTMANEDQFILDVDEQTLEQAPRLTEANPVYRTDPDFVRDVYKHFEADPYWLVFDQKKRSRSKDM